MTEEEVRQRLEEMGARVDAVVERFNRVIDRLEGMTPEERQEWLVRSREVSR